jgi:3-deoxy-manno-octulosonate cytidylyltransferase (CMP-KDO synthetase)
LTRLEHQSGTDRVAEVASQFPEYEIVVNVQGDEPELVAHDVDAVVGLLKRDLDLTMATLAIPIRDRSLVENPACVKVVVDRQQRALYFSRAAIPFDRNPNPGAGEDSAYLQHVGVYAYRRNFLLGYSRLPPSRLEKTEALEQLRALEAGFRIGVFVGETAAKGIDTLEDYRAFVRRQTSC